MKKNKKLIFSLFLLFMSTLLNSINVFASSDPKAMINFVGDSIQIGRLRYGIGFSDPFRGAGTTDVTKNYGVPNVQYITADNKVIDHIFSSAELGSPIEKQSGASTTSGLNLIETEGLFVKSDWWVGYIRW